MYIIIVFSFKHEMNNISTSIPCTAIIYRIKHFGLQDEMYNCKHKKKYRVKAANAVTNICDVL